MSHGGLYVPAASEDPHTPVASRDPRTRAAAAYRETAADSPRPLCEASRGPDGQLDHDPGCLMRAVRRRAVR